MSFIPASVMAKLYVDECFILIILVINKPASPTIDLPGAMTSESFLSPIILIISEI